MVGFCEEKYNKRCKEIEGDKMETKKPKNCMICGEELAYLTKAIPVKCLYCGKEESAKHPLSIGPLCLQRVPRQRFSQNNHTILPVFKFKEPDEMAKNHNEASHYANAWA